MAGSGNSTKKNHTAVVPKLKHPKVHNNKDRISNLPEPLLSRIISSLPAKEAVATSILSKRWRFLWTSITNLHLYDNLGLVSSYTKNMQPPTNFINYVNRILLLHDSPSIHQFSLILHEFSEPFHINKWIRDAVTRNITELELGLPVFGGEDPIELPSSLFHCKTLEVLKLSGFLFDIPKSGSVSFPKLRVLHLDHVYCGEIPAEEGSVCFPVLKMLHLLYVEVDTEEDDDSLTKLMRHCPVLEDLLINIDHDTSIEMCAPALRSAEIGFNRGFNRGTSTCKIQIDAPALRYLKIMGLDLSQGFSLTEPYSLIDTNLQVLHLESVHCGEIPADDGSTCSPVLKILHLLYVGYKKDDDSVSKLMGNCPVLEDLLIRRTDDDNVLNIDVCDPTLRSAEFSFDLGYNCEVQIDAPALQYLQIWDLSQLCFAKEPYSLIGAKLMNVDHSANFTVTGEQGYNVHKLIKAVSNAQCLSVSSVTVEAIKAAGICNIFPLFRNLLRLEVYVSRSVLSVLQSFLENSIKLQHLVIRKGHKLCGVEEKWCTGLVACLPKRLLSSLKWIEICEVDGCTNSVDLIKYMLMNAEILQRMTIRTSILSAERYQLLQKISLFPRGSTRCEVAFS